MRVKRIGVLTGGGDCPGLNAVLRAVTKSAIVGYGMEVFGFKDGYQGLVENDFVKLSYDDVSGILTRGGTILGTSNTANPYRFPIKENKKLIIKDMSKKAVINYKKLKLDALICIGGDGTLSIAAKLCEDGLNIIGVPKTIDNDLIGTDRTFGFNTAVSIVAEAIDRLHSTAESHHRVIIVEVMGRYAGWIALHAGIAGGGDIILIPEIPYDLNKIIDIFEDRKKKGRHFSIVVIAEGAKPKGGKLAVKKIVEESTDPIRLGGIGMHLADEIERVGHQNCRVVVLGHLQRGGTPTAEDRILATQYGCEALRMVIQKKYGYMVGLKGNKLVHIPLKRVAGRVKKVAKNHPLIEKSRSIGISFGQ